MNERLYFCLDGDKPHGPESKVPAGCVAELAVPAELQRYVTQVVACREEIPEHEAVLERVFPDGALRLIISLGDLPSSTGGGADAPAIVTGAAAEPSLVRLAGRIEGLSVSLRAGVAQQVLGVPAHELAGQCVGLDVLWGSDGVRLMDQMAETHDDKRRVELLSSAVLAQVARHRSDSSLTAGRAARRLAQVGGKLSVKDLATEIGVAPRRLQQLFRSHVGLTPREWARLCRFRECLRLLRHTPKPGWAQLAIDAGFYDQAHLANEFRRLCGLSPTGYLRLSRHTSPAPSQVSHFSKT